MVTPCTHASGLGNGWRPLVDVAVEPMLDLPPAERECEVVERKGVGHPDSICDALAEEFSLALCRFHRRNFGSILHHNADDYRGKVEALAQRVLEVARPLLPGDVTVAVNAADDFAHGRCYLTVSGTSAEAGDDGEAGRGNRTGGLITPCRPMTMEATAGKNPINHVGKLYNILAHLVASELAAALPQLQAVECLLASQIGAPIDAPRLACVRARAPLGIGNLAAELATRTCGRIATAPELWRDILDRNFQLY